VLVSEAMLQQTQVARVVPRYHAFLEQFPTVSACAAAPAGDVVRAWSGLGFNRRAVNLHRSAVAVVERFAGRIPDRLEDLLTLPGIGPYTARAVLAFAFERDVGVLDVNGLRVLARAFGHTDQAFADSLVPPGRAWEWNQAVLDLGATVCTARSPRCAACPLAARCDWARAGRPEPDPGARRTSQGPFAGSDREGRGRLVAALRRGPVPFDEVPSTAGWPADPIRAHRVAGGLVDDGLAVVDDDRGALRLP
jgi:A/G-specific adenine glycosylase